MVKMIEWMRIFPKWNPLRHEHLVVMCLYLLQVKCYTMHSRLGVYCARFHIRLEVWVYCVHFIRDREREPPTTHLLRLRVQYVKPTADCIYHKLSVFVCIVSRLFDFFVSPVFVLTRRMSDVLPFFFLSSQQNIKAALKWFSSAIFHSILIW